MQIEMITKQDLETFRQQLLSDLKPYLSSKEAAPDQWLKSADVRKLLKISPGTLQKLRITGALAPVKIAGSFYYKHSDVQQLLTNGHL
ncbi:Helix-turn-helix domain-containing protein [Dyadobacter koreensis]|uniref:Helix-turn-helix domain-containing protein n=1 Tax=Dyadobacter koreensis TaxID=408657 RepID=A0A1H7B7R9_9BACT|nr:helix-turn-helix domain-containing protein [Dyadobacter koreensis]SEJ69445.1 Helix-turn-helix domain-containing protein [Dyadobacter koreensis]